MRLTANREKLEAAMAVAKQLVPSRSTKPILMSLAFRGKKNSNVEIHATNLEAAVVVTAEDSDVEVGGVGLLPADKAHAILREIDGDIVEIEWEKDGGAAIVSSAKSRFRLATEDPAEFPEPPSRVDDGGVFEVAADLLATMIRKVRFAVATGDAANHRYALCGVLFELKDGILRLVATDGKRLVKIERRCESSEAFSRVVPRESVMLLSKIAEEGGSISLRFTDTALIASSANALLQAELLQGHFPPYQEILPKTANVAVEIPRLAFMNLVRQASLLTTKDSSAVVLTLAPGALIMKSRAPDVGDGEVSMPVEYTGEPFEIAFNPHYLMDVAKAVDAEKIGLDLTEPTAPGMFREKSEEWACVVMPISIR